MTFSQLELKAAEKPTEKTEPGFLKKSSEFILSLLLLLEILAYKELRKIDHVF